MSSPCRAAALRFLKIRPRSVHELRVKLAGKGFSVKEIDESIEHLKSMDLLNDRVFADGWIRYRLARPFGFVRIIGELQEKGIADELINRAVAQARGEYQETGAALEFACRRAQRLGNMEPHQRRKKVFDFLIRRGFPEDVAMKVLKNI